MSMDAPTPSTPALTGEDRLWGALAHLSGLTYFSGVGHILGPMIIWLWKRDTNAFVAEEAKEALNFNISVTIYGLVAWALVVVLIGFALLPALGVFHVVCVIIAALKASDGRGFRYPLNLRLVK